MDEMKLKLSTKIMRGIVAKIISKAITKKLGANIDIKLNELEVTTMNDNVYLHANVDGEISKEEFMNLIKSIGLD